MNNRTKYSRSKVILDCHRVDLLKKTEAFIDTLTVRESFCIKSAVANKCSAMLRYGEYSPNNPELRVTAAPYIGLGEYEQRRKYLLQQQKADYLRHLTQIKNNIRSGTTVDKELPSNKENLGFKDVASSLPLYSEIHQSLPNALLNLKMDKPKSILSNRRTGSPRDRLLSEFYTPSCLSSLSYQDRADELERERLKRESYQYDLRLQIEEKRRLQEMHNEQDRLEEERENRRLEQQILRMQEEQLMENHRRSQRDEQIRRHSEDLLRRKQELQSRSYRKHTESESSLRSTDVTSKTFSHYSPPVSRRIPYSFNIPSTSVFAEPSSRYTISRYDTSSSNYPHYQHNSRYDTFMRNRMDAATTASCYGGVGNTYSSRNVLSRFDSLSRIDSLNRRMESFNIQDSMSSLYNGQRRHSATQQDFTMLRKSPKLQRRNSSSRFDDTLPVPILKARSPVAKELKNSIPFNSSRQSSDAIRKLEDKWQTPAVQKSFVSNDETTYGHSRNILTQLGAIRMQLQQEQISMEETLRKRSITQPKAVDIL